jgi:hypothetical protein
MITSPSHSVEGLTTAACYVLLQIVLTCLEVHQEDSAWLINVQ